MGQAAIGGLNWSVALRLGRVSNLPTVWTNVLAGVTLAGGGAAAPQLLLLLVALSLFYLAGMYLNDAYDREIDARERPGRPIPSGAVSARTVFLSGYGMMAGGLVLLLWTGFGLAGGTGWAAPASGAALALAIVAYDRHHKANPLSPVVMGVCRMLVYVTAGLAVARALPAAVPVGAMVLLCYLIGLTYAAKQESLNRMGALWPLAFLAVPFAYGLPIALGGVAGFALWLGFLGWVLYALSFLVRPGRMNVPRAVVSLIAGISLLDALLIAGHNGGSLVWVAVSGFVLTLALQRHVPGT